MANTNSQGSPPAGHGGSQVSGAAGAGSTASSDKQRAADLAERSRQATVARGNIAANKARVKSAARSHIGPLK